MEKLIHTISYLLTQHDCVVVPRLGAFIVRYESARVGVDGKITPPTATLTFDERVVHTDQLIVQTLSLHASLSLLDANKLIDSEIDAIFNALNNGDTVTLGTLGCLKQNQEGKLSFVIDAPVIALQHYGFDAFTMTPIVALLTENESPTKIHPATEFVSNKEMVYIGINKRWLRGIAVAAVAIVMLMFISTPVDPIDAPVSYASLITTEWMPSIELPTEVNREDVLVQNDIPVKEDEQDTEPVVAQIVKEPVVATPQTSPASNRRYYIIIGSQPTIALAQKTQKYYQDKGFEQAAIIESDDKARIYLCSFDNKSAAESYLQTLKATHANMSDAWVFSSKQ